MSREGDEPNECTDGIDNDGNGRADCAEPGCRGTLGCAPSGPPDTSIVIPTGDSGVEPLPGCDLPEVPSGANDPIPGDGLLRTTIVGSDAYTRLGYAVMDVAVPGQTGSMLVAGAPQMAYYEYYQDGEKPASAIWVFDAPLPAGTLGKTGARSVLTGVEHLIPDTDGTVLAAGDLTGDGVAEVVSGGFELGETPFHVLELPTPAGELPLTDVALARYDRDSHWTHTFLPSIADWNLDGVGDLAFGVASAGAFSFGAEVMIGPPAGINKMADPDHDGAIAWFDVREYNANSFGTGWRSRLIHDTDGDGAPDLLVSGEGWELVPFQGDSGSTSGGFALFSGNTTGAHDVDDAIAILYAPCDPDPWEPVPVGDVAGDDRPDVAVRGTKAYVGGERRGAVWILSRLGPSPTWQSLTMVSDAVIIGHEDSYFADVTGLGDLDGDGHDDLAVLTDLSLSIFLGPLEGFLDLYDADLTLMGSLDWWHNGYGVVYGNGSLAAGDMDGDGVTDVIVGDPIRGTLQQGEIRVYDGAALVARLRE
jgi:hypothetical protein